MRMPGMDGAEFLQHVASQLPDVVRILLTGYSDMQATVQAINDGHIYQYISKPWDDYDLKITLQQAIEKKRLEDERHRLLSLISRQNKELKELNLGLEEKVRERTHELEQAHNAIKSSYIATVKVFSNLLELREGGIAGHSRRVAEQAHKISIALGVEESESQQVLFAGLLHDIGKISMSDTILARPYHELSAQEQAIFHKHPVIGEALLMGLDYLQGAARIIRAHHERYDGSGYPDELKGEAIPMGARILAVVNDYDDLKFGAYSSRKYSRVQALEVLRMGKNKNYDPEVVDSLVTHETNVALEKDVPSIRIRSDRLKAGMVLTRDLVTEDGVLLLAKGFVVDENLIEKLAKFEQAMGDRFSIHVQALGK
jgi:putative nucleotidyltransferase with HDIG domain